MPAMAYTSHVVVEENVLILEVSVSDVVRMKVLQTCLLLPAVRL